MPTPALEDGDSRAGARRTSERRSSGSGGWSLAPASRRHWATRRYRRHSKGWAWRRGVSTMLRQSSPTVHWRTGCTRQRGDGFGAVRVAAHLALDHCCFRGEYAIGNAWLQRACRPLEGFEPRLESGWLAIAEVRI